MGLLSPALMMAGRRGAKELKVLDPCMGSGHFLTFALPILVRMRETEEGLSLPETPSQRSCATIYSAWNSIRVAARLRLSTLRLPHGSWPAATSSCRL